MNSKPFRMATGIGSLPFQEEGRALQLILDNLPLVPHWPQLPRLGPGQNFAEQFLGPLLKLEILKIKEGGSSFFDTGDPGFLNRMSDFFDLYYGAREESQGEGGDTLDLFAMPPGQASGFYAFRQKLQKEGTGGALFVKGQTSGPVSIGLKVTDASFQPSFYQEMLREMLVKTLEMQVEWQARLLRELGLPVIIFIDEPGICFYGQAFYIGLSRQDIKESLDTMVQAIHRQGALAGAHICSGIDWSILMEAGMDIINLDAVNYFDHLLVYKEQFQEYVEGGGIIAWGVVPSGEQVMGENRETVLRRLEEILTRLAGKGFPRDALERQLMVTPSCGTGTLTEEEAEKVYNLTGELQLYLSGTS